MELYHETQCRQQCLLHALNNLFQKPTFTANDLDRLADSLSPGKLPLPLLHPHRTIFLGNWDVSVLELAVESVGKSLKWHDERDDQFQNPALMNCFGLVVNVKSPGRFAALLGSRHWFAIRKLEDNFWYNLDSKLPAPERINKLVGSDGDGENVAASKGAARMSSSNLNDNEDTALQIFLTTLQRDSSAKVFLII